MVSATIATVLAQDSSEVAHAQWCSVAAQLRGKLPKLGEVMHGADDEVLSYMNFPRAHRTTNGV